MSENEERKARKYVPSFVLEGDGPTITDGDGNEHETQPGSRLVLRQDYPWELILLDADTMTPAEYVEAACRLFRRQVVEWNWTNSQGEPYAQPSDEAGFRAAVLDLLPLERQWLTQHCWEDTTNVPNE
jgi:hypothetical protein